MTKFFIATLVGLSLMIPTQALAKTHTAVQAKKEIHKKAVNKGVAKKAVAKKGVAKKAIKKASLKKSSAKVEKAVPRKVVSLDFSQPEKRQVNFKNVQVVKAKNLPQKTAMVKERKPASQPMTVKQLKKSTKPYWAAYCRDGIVLNSQVYCALKNPQKNGLKSKTTKMAINRDLESKKRK